MFGSHGNCTFSGTRLELAVVWGSVEKVFLGSLVSDL